MLPYAMGSWSGRAGDGLYPRGSRVLIPAQASEQRIRVNIFGAFARQPCQLAHDLVMDYVFKFYTVPCGGLDRQAV